MEKKAELISKVMENDSISFRVIFILCFVICFMVTLLTYFLPMGWRSWLPGSEGGKTLFDSTKAGVYSFMSFLT
jgi:hypothetical protein